jgi:DNA replication protein DnaC
VSEIELIEHAAGTRFARLWADLVAVCDNRKLDALLLEEIAYQMSRRLRDLDEEERNEEIALLNGRLPALEGLSGKKLDKEHLTRLVASDAWTRRSHGEIAKRIPGGAARGTLMKAIGRLREKGFLCVANTPDGRDQAYLYLVNLRVLNGALREAAEASAKPAEREGITLVPTPSVQSSTVDSSEVNSAVVDSEQAGSDLDIAESKGEQAAVEDATATASELDRARSKSRSSIDVGDGDTADTGGRLPTLPIFRSEEIAAARIEAAQLPQEWSTPIELAKLEAPSPASVKAIEAARSLVAGETSALVISGGPASGKSTIAAAVVWSLLRVPRKVVWVDALDAEDALGASYSDPSYERMKKMLAGENGLVVDDLDRISHGGAKKALAAAVRKALSAGRPLVITTELEPDELGAALGETTARRVLARAAVTQIDGPDLASWERVAVRAA